MLKKLKEFLKRLDFSKSIKTEKLLNTFAKDEKIARSIFSPINISKKGDKLKPNAFKTPAGIDEVSVNRLSFSSPDFCKKISKTIENPEYDRNYFGIAMLYKKEIDNCDCSVVYSPQHGNNFHADIKIGYIPERGQPLPAEFQKKVKDLSNTARLFKDPNPESLKWEGDPIE